MNAKRIYLDHAATSFPKNDAVLDAMDRFARDCGATAGRGGYASARIAQDVVAKLRRKLAELIGAESSPCISFHASGTAALNAAIHGIVRPGDHVVTTAAEHNSVLRPLRYLQEQHGVTLTVVPVDSIGRVSAEAVLAATTSSTRMVAVTSASNVTGCVQPITAIGEGLRDKSAVFLCDAAQSLGIVPVDVQEMGIDLLAAPGHKCCGGPAGTAMLYVRSSLHDQICPMVQGGTGSVSESLEMPNEMPTRLEAGNLNVPALAGWLAAMQLDSDHRDHHASLSARLHEGLSGLEGVSVIGEAGPLPIVSLILDGISASDLSMVLDSEYGIETRSGFHCAALIHEHVGSAAEGTLRLSAGATTTAEEVDAAIEAVKTICLTLQEFSKT